jgi:hypothetical protein
MHDVLVALAFVAIVLAPCVVAYGTGVHYYEIDEDLE